MEVRRKKRLKIIIPLCVCAILLIGIVLYLFLPPTRGKYRLELQLDYRSGEERGTALSGSERKTLETKTGEEVIFRENSSMGRRVGRKRRLRKPNC